MAAEGSQETVFDSPDSLQAKGLPDAAAKAWVGSGAGTMPWVRANAAAAWKHSCGAGIAASACPSSWACETSGAMP